ncbi:MAG: SLBB domain-containing protein [Bacteroidia bacterium]|nr:SLBB domain-containing protein [Bacteroidia bacterium]
MRRIYPGQIVILILCCLLPVLTKGQTTTIPKNLPKNVGDKLPEYSDRLKQLQDAGIKPPSIPTQGGVKPSTTADSGFPNPEFPNKDNIDLEGKEDVLDEEDKEYQDKPKEINEVLVEDSLESFVYGHQLFVGGNPKYDFTPTASVSDNYVIGPGDIFNITIQGREERYESLTVEEDGAVLRPFIGKIYVAGLSFGEAKKRIARRYRNIFSASSSIEVRLTADPRPINVNFVGEVARPGAYKLDAATPAFNALFIAGGITDIGSVRNIMIKREGKIVQVLDLYEYLLFGINEPIYLQDNDFIFVPVQGKIASVTGPVRRPMKYELREGENMKTLINFAGGLSYDAKLTEAQVARLENEREVVIDFNLSEIVQNSNKDFNLLDGDRLILREVNKGAFNIIQIFGDIEYPGTYQLNEGDKISDVIMKAGGLSIESYRERAYVVRIIPKSSELLYIPINLGEIFPTEADTINYDNINNIDLQFFDGIIIFSQKDFLDDRVLEVTGHVRNPQVIESTPTLTLKDVLYLVGGLKDDADFNNIELTTITRAEDLDLREVEKSDKEVKKATADGSEGAKDDGGKTDTKPAAVVSGKDGSPDGSEGELETVDDDVELIKRISIPKNWEDDPMIDTLKVYQFDQIKVYSKYDFIFFKYLEIEGSVANPGRYQIKRGMTLKDAIYRAGGLAEDAAKNLIELHLDIDYEERGNFNTLTDKKEIVRIKLDTTWQESKIADSILIGKYHKLVVRSEKDFFQQGFVDIKGLVNKPGNYPVLPQMTLKDLIFMAEGLKMEADFDNIELSRVFESVTETGEILPVPITINTITSTQNWQLDPILDSIKVNAFDQVIVRKNPNFRLQESVFLEGEVLVEGEYNKAKKDEQLSSLISRSGGITELAYLEGAFIRRPDIGNIAIKLDRALKRPGSKFNIPLLDGDTLVVPARVDIVSIEGNVLRPGIKVLYEPSKDNLKYYTRLAGGFAKRTKKNEVTVTYVDGRVKGTRKFLMFRKYPKIQQGAEIQVAAKPDRESNGLPKINLSDTIASLTSILTFYLLIDRTLDNTN